MKKKKSYVMMFVILCLFSSSCGSIGGKHADNAKVHNVRYVSDEPMIATMSDEETERLRYILKEEDGWLDAEPCVCTKEGGLRLECNARWCIL